MTHQVTLTISDHLMKRARYLAQRQSRKTEDVLADAIVLDDDHEIIDWTEPNVELEREKKAYLAMHAELQRTMSGKHVAFSMVRWLIRTMILISLLHGYEPTTRAVPCG